MHKKHRFSLRNLYKTEKAAEEAPAPATTEPAPAEEKTEE